MQGTLCFSATEGDPLIDLQQMVLTVMQERLGKNP